MRRQDGRREKSHLNCTHRGHSWQKVIFSGGVLEQLLTASYLFPTAVDAEIASRPPLHGVVWFSHVLHHSQRGSEFQAFCDSPCSVCVCGVCVWVGACVWCMCTCVCMLFKPIVP